MTGSGRHKKTTGTLHATEHPAKRDPERTCRYPLSTVTTLSYATARRYDGKIIHSIYTRCGLASRSKGPFYPALYNSCRAGSTVFIPFVFRFVVISYGIYKPKRVTWFTSEWATQASGPR